MTEGVENIIQSECLNCKHQLPAAATYCPNCSQKTTTGLISLKEFISNFFDNVFNLDSRIAQTIRWLCIPAKLTKEYFKGKHKSYSHPIRIYLLMSIVFFAALKFIGDLGDGSDIVKMDFGGNETTTLEEMIDNEAYRITFIEELDSLSEDIELFQDEIAKAALDTLIKKMGNGFIDRDSFNLQLFGTNRQFDYRDILTLDRNELVEKYEIEGFWNQLFVKQSIHFVHDQSGYVRELLHNIPLMLLAMMPFLALFMKLLYIRRKRFYIEHLVLNFHHHAFAFLLLTIVLLVPKGVTQVLILPAIIIIFIFLFLTMKRYYGQRYGKTFLKFVLFTFFYFISFILVFFMTVVISLLLF